MSTITLTAEQQTAKTNFATFLSGGCQTRIGGFTLDPNVPLIYTIDPTGQKLLASGALKDVNLAAVNPGIKPAQGTEVLPVLSSLPMAWDMKGIAQGNQAFNLVQVVS